MGKTQRTTQLFCSRFLRTLFAVDSNRDGLDLLIVLRVFGVIRPQATTQQNNLFCFDSLTTICLPRTSRQYFCYVRRLPVVLFLYADCGRCFRTDVLENSSASTAPIEIGKLSILAWEQCGSNYISSTQTYLKCRCGNLVIFFVLSQNLGYLSDQEPFETWKRSFYRSTYR